MQHLIFIFLLLATLVQPRASGQSISEKDAKNAVAMIVQHSGIPQNFEVRENADIKTAVAFIKSKKRFIEYNPKVIGKIIDSTQTDWSAVAILAHEIGHHLMGHTLNPTEIHPGDELACDKYSGFILQHMGASLDESTAVMMAAGSVSQTKRHPPKSARIEAIKIGWQEAFAGKTRTSFPEFADDEFLFKVKFEGDDNLYYVDRANDLLWFDNYANPIPLGKLEPSETDQFEYVMGWQEEEFFVDTQGHIWNMTTFNALMKVGQLENISPSEDGQN